MEMLSALAFGASRRKSGERKMSSKLDDFAEELLGKLKGNTKASNFMQCYADERYNFDLHYLKSWEAGLAAKVLHGLLKSQDFQIKISSKPTSASVEAQKRVKCLDSLLQRQRGDQKNHGVDTLRIGFPLVECFDEVAEKWLLCPLALWKVRLSQANGRFVLTRETRDGVEINDAFAHFLLADAEIDISKAYNESKRSMELEKAAAMLGEDMGRALEMISSCCTSGPHKVPTENPRGLNESGKAKGLQLKVFWGAVLGIFETGSATLSKDLVSYKQKGALELPGQAVLKKGRDLLFSAIELDPSQFQAVRMLAETKNVVIHGPPGCGKSQTLAGVISCAGANGLRTLVVCEKRTPLEIIQRKLGELEWKSWAGDKFTTLITSVQEERGEVVEAAQRNRTDAEKISIESLRKEADLLEKDIFRLEREIENEEQKFLAHREMNEQIISFNLKMKEAISFVIKRKLEGRIILSIPVSQSSFQKRIFAEDHCLRLDRCQEHLSREMKAVIAVLNFSSPSLRGEDDGFSPVAVVQAAEQLKSVIRQKLNKRAAIFDRAKHFHEQKLRFELEFWTNTFEELKDVKEKLTGIPDSEIQRYDSLSWFDRLVPSWSRRDAQAQLRYFHGALGRIREEILEKELKVTLPTNFTSSNIGRIVEWCKEHHDRSDKTLKDFESLKPTQAWEASEEVRAGYIDALKAANTEILEELKAGIFSTKTALTTFAKCLEVHDPKECQWAFEKQLLNFGTSSLVALKQAKDSIDCLFEFGLVDDEHFFSEFLRMDSVENSSWGDRMKLCLLAKEVEGRCRDLITSDFVLDRLADSIAQIRTKMQGLLLIRQAVNMRESIAAYEARSGNRFEQLFNKTGKNIVTNSLREIVREFNLFLSCFPVVFCTPEVASTLFAGHKDAFDIVVFDEASQSLVHDSYASLLKGKKLVVAGDNKQMPPSTMFQMNSDPNDSGDEGEDGFQLRRSIHNAANAESLLDFASVHSFAFENVDLHFHYRSASPALMEFHVAAIYPHLTLCPEKGGSVGEPALRVVRVANAVYKDQKNEKEALEVVNQLRHLVHRGFSIAVATFNDSQRRCILKAIKQESVASEEFLHAVRTMQAKGTFMVKNLENLQGDEVDVLVVSTTFGPNSRGRFDRRLGRITFSGTGYRYLNVLFSRARKQVYLVTSIPPADSSPERVLDDAGVLSGPSMLFGYISYASAVSDGDERRVKAILDSFRNDDGRRAPENDQNSNTSLEDVIYNILTKRGNFRTSKITRENGSNSLLRGLRVQFPNNRSLVIECSTHESSLHSIYRKSILESLGYEFFQVWPANWLDNPRREFDRLRKVIQLILRKARASAPAEVSCVTPACGLPGSLVEPAPIDTASSSASLQLTDISSTSIADEDEPMPHRSAGNDVDVKLDEPYLVKYGASKKFIVFKPERFITDDEVCGHWGNKKRPIKIKVERLQPLRADLGPDSFYDEVEFDKLLHFTQENSGDDDSEFSPEIDAERFGFSSSSSTSSSGKKRTNHLHTQQTNKRRRSHE